MANNWNKYILWFAQEHVNFREAEFDSIMEMFHLQHRKLTDDLIKPYWIVEFPDEKTAIQYAARSILLRYLIEFWSHATLLPVFHENLQQFIKNNIEIVDGCKDVNFKITVETYNKHISHNEKVDRINLMDYLPLEGKVDLKNPEMEFFYIEYWGIDPNDVPEKPDDILFGRLFRKSQRDLIKELSLKKRKFIGNTSMDAQLSLLMANQALVREGDIVLDPFVGSGSLLVSAAKFGGYVIGADIDYMMLHARCRPSRISQKVREKDESIRANLKQYNCEDKYLDVVVSDFSNHMWKSKLQFDAIITDPPYGIREATEKIELTSKVNMVVPDLVHYPSMSHYKLQEMYKDLLNFSALHLKLGGRLVCWLPFHREDYTDDMVPGHKYLKLIANSEQPLTGQTSRRLLTFVKDGDNCLNGDLKVLKPTVQMFPEFRDRYFNGLLESRTERRIRRAQQRIEGLTELQNRGKVVRDIKSLKCDLNKARFDVN